MKFSRGKKVVTYVTDASLHTTFFVAPSRRGSPWLKAKMSRQFQKTLVEPDRAAIPLDHRGLQVVVQKAPRRAAKERKGIHMALQKARHLHVEEKL